MKKKRENGRKGKHKWEEEIDGRRGMKRNGKRE